MGLFPTDAVNGQQVTNANGTTFEYVAVDDKWVIVNTLTISDVAYDATTWDANTDGATKNAIRDKIETMETEIDGNCTTAEAITAINAAGLAIATTKLLAFDDGGSVDIIRDEDNMVSDDINALCTQQSIKAYADTKYKKKTGTYTGNAVNNRQITDLGFTPKSMIIITVINLNAGYSWSGIKIDSMPEWYCHFPHEPRTYNNALKFISDGFEVDNDANDHWNSSGQLYYWTAWG